MAKRLGAGWALRRLTRLADTPSCTPRHVCPDLAGPQVTYSLVSWRLHGDLQSIADGQAENSKGDDSPIISIGTLAPTPC